MVESPFILSILTFLNRHITETVRKASITLILYMPVFFHILIPPLLRRLSFVSELFSIPHVSFAASINEYLNPLFSIISVRDFIFLLYFELFQSLDFYFFQFVLQNYTGILLCYCYLNIFITKLCLIFFSFFFYYIIYI